MGFMHSVEGEDSHKCSAQVVDVPGSNLGKQCSCMNNYILLMLIIIVSKKDLPLRYMHSVEGEDSLKCSAQMVDVPGCSPGKQRLKIYVYTLQHF